MRSSLLVVHVGSMTKPHDNHQQHVVLDRVDDPVVAHPNAESGPTLKSAGRRRTRILGQQCDRALNPKANLGVERA